MHRNRIRIQIAALIIANSYFLSSILKYIPLPILNCYACPLASGACPLGTIQRFLIMFAVPFYTMGFLGIIGSVLGGMTCGWICPFGFLQDLLYRMSKHKIYIAGRYNIARFVVLGLMILIPLVTLEPWFCKLCPAGTLEAGIPLVLSYDYLRPMVGQMFYIKIIILFLFLLSAIFIKRPFCRFICPLGAILSLFNPISKVRLEVDDSCNKCGKCERICPMEIRIYENPNSMSCIRCLECTRYCEHIKFKS